LLAAGALYQHAAALAVGNERALAQRLERLFAARSLAVIVACVPLLFHRKIRTGPRDDILAELFAQYARPHFLDLAFLELSELERTVGDADQPVHLEPEMRHHIAYLAVLAFADREHQPDIGTLVALQRRVDGAVFHALDLDAALQLVKLRLRN